MIPERIERFLKTMKEPDFFIEENRAVCAEIHDCISRYVEGSTETMEVAIDRELLVQVDVILKNYGWTAEEAMVLFYMWCIVCPERMKLWCAKIQKGENK